MLHTKFRGNQSAGSGEEETNMPRTKFRSLYPRRLHIKFGFDRPIGFGEEDF